MSDDEENLELYNTCLSVNSLEDLKAQINSYTALKEFRTSEGQNCLHLLSYNINFIRSIERDEQTNGRFMRNVDSKRASELVDFIVDEICLHKEDSRCLLLEVDSDGRIPFQKHLEDWVHIHEGEEESRNSERPTARLSFNPSELLSMSHFSSSNQTKPEEFEYTPETHHALCSILLLSEIMNRLEVGIAEMPWLRWKNDSNNAQPPSMRSLIPTRNKDTTINLGIEVTFLSKVFDKVSEIENFMKTLLLVLRDSHDREDIFSLFFIEQVMFQKNNVGPWIVEMLKSKKSERSRNSVITYLKRLSTLVEKKRLDSDDYELDELATKLGYLHGLIPAMMTLDTRMTEEAAMIPLITRALDKKITSPFVSCVLFFDILMFAVLLVSFRETAFHFMMGTGVLPWAYYLANSAVFYFILRMWGKMVALHYFFNSYSVLEFRRSKIWNILNTLSVLISWGCIWAMGYIGNVNSSRIQEKIAELNDITRLLIALTTVLLWLNLIETLTSVNIKLATFVLAIRKITRDIFWYLLLLVAFGLCTSQIMFTLMVPNLKTVSGLESIDECARDDQSHCRFCNDPNTDTPDECLATFYYTRMYASVLGLDAWAFDAREDDLEVVRGLFSEVLFGIFSFFTIVLLLNFVIAVISDSYEKHLLQSNKLFGRARIRFLADTLAFQHLFVNLKDPGQERWSHGGFTFLVSSWVLLTSFVAFEFMNISLNKLIDNAWMLGSICLNAWIVICFNIILSQQVALRAGKKHSRRILFLIILVPISFLQWIIKHIQGSSLSFIDDSKNGAEDWRGRVHYLKREMHRIGKENNCEIAKLRSEISHLKQRENEQMKEILELLKR